jgi:hypothetical protein
MGHIYLPEGGFGDEGVGYDGFKHREGKKVHAIVDEDSKLIAISPGNIHDSKIFNNLYD